MRIYSNILILSCIFTHFISDSRRAEAKTPNQFEFNVKDFGAKGDGKSDDTFSIQRVIDKTSKNNTRNYVIIPKGIYLINTDIQKGGGIWLKDNTTVRIEKNAVLKAIPNSSTNYVIIGIRNAKNVKIVGGILEGDRLSHLNNKGEWGHCVMILGKSFNVLLSGMTAHDCWGDGFYIGGGRNITIDKVISDHNRRQGLSITAGSQIVVKNSVFKNTRGTSPESGIDIEPNENVIIDDVKIYNNYISGNAGNGISDGVPNIFIESSKITNVYIAKNKITGNGINSSINRINSGVELDNVIGHQILANDISRNIGFGLSIKQKYSDSNFILNNIFYKNSKYNININFKNNNHLFCNIEK